MSGKKPDLNTQYANMIAWHLRRIDMFISYAQEESETSTLVATLENRAPFLRNLAATLELQYPFEPLTTDQKQELWRSDLDQACDLSPKEVAELIGEARSPIDEVMGYWDYMDEGDE